MKDELEVGLGVNPTFFPIAIESGLLLDLSEDVFPTRVCGWRDGTLVLSNDATHYGMVTQGRANLNMNQERFPLQPGMFFALPGRGDIECDEGGQGLVISRLGYQGLWQLGGPLESKGRLRYIDGCS